MSAFEYARRFAAWARARREAMSRVHRCCMCGRSDLELAEFDGRLYCRRCTTDLLLPVALPEGQHA